VISSTVRLLVAVHRNVFRSIVHRSIYVEIES
jgi:hypothetical protein